MLCPEVITNTQNTVAFPAWKGSSCLKEVPEQWKLGSEDAKSAGTDSPLLSFLPGS